MPKNIKGEISMNAGQGTNHAKNLSSKRVILSRDTNSEEASSMKSSRATRLIIIYRIIRTLVGRVVATGHVVATMIDIWFDLSILHQC